MADGNARKLDRGECFDRITTLERLAPSGDQKVATFKASLSSELPVERWFGTEILSHAKDAIDMARASRGLSLLFNHDMDAPIGRASNIRLDGGKLRAELTFSPNSEQAQRIAADVDQGFLGDVSIRYSIDEYQTTTDEHGHDTVTITRWTPMEVSIVTVPADHTVGVGRSRATGKTKGKETSMSDGNDAGNEAGSGAGGETVATLTGRQSRVAKKAADEALRANSQRIEDIQDLFANSRFQGEAFADLRDECIKDHRVSLEQARAKQIALIESLPAEELVTPTASRKVEDEIVRSRTGRDPFVQAGADQGEKLGTGLQRAIELRAGILKGEERARELGSNEFAGLTLVEMARVWLERHGFRTAGLNKMQMVGAAFTSGQRAISLGTSDFTGILANVANKALLAGWEETPSSYRAWTRKGILPDFKKANRTGLSGITLLDKVPETGEIEYGKATDRTEYIQLVTYAKLFSISRQAIINDDLGAFTSIPARLGRAADRTINKAVYTSLTSASGVGPTLNQDSVALFDSSTHKNYDASSGSITVANVDTGRQKMRRQKDPNNSEPLNIRPKYLLVPAALETTANVLVASEKDPLGDTNAKGGATQGNPFYKSLQVICEPTLDDATNGTTAWYLLADQNEADTYEVAFLDGNDVPYLETKDGWTVDGVEMKVRLDAGISPLDFRGVYRKRGA